MIQVRNGGPAQRLVEAVLFPFDSASVPFSAGLRLQLVPGKSTARKNPVVVSRGEPGEPDDAVLRYYGTVIQVGDELRMWYQASGSLDVPGGQRRLCYAVSGDGVNWEKPRLGLVEYNGNTRNNIVDIQGGRCVLASTPIIYDPEDPDSGRRFKMNFESQDYNDRFAVAYSPDGLRWTESSRNPVGPWLEQSGLIKFDGGYYVNGQGGSHYGALRTMVTFASYDFEDWTQSSCLGFRRDSIPPRPLATHWNTDEEVHMGAGVWDRGNVIVGVYGMWHGHPTSNRGHVTMDLGLVVSNDALEYREPVPDFRLIPSHEEAEFPRGDSPALMQGQGMYNVGDETMHWYGVWQGDGVRLARWARDRLGYFEQFRAGQLDWARQTSEGLMKRMDEVPPHCITCPMVADGQGARVFANVGGLSEQSWMTVEVLDVRFRPLPGYSGADCVPLRSDGLRQPIVWRTGKTVQGIDGPFRLRVNLDGARPEDARLYALYVEEPDQS